MKLYTAKDVGCYGDGTFGDSHVCQRAISLATENGWPFALPDNMSDEEMDLAAKDCVDYLNEKCTDSSVHFTFDSGDLILTESEGQ